MESSKRLFASGSRQAPDPYDQFLEREGYYRKHVARDATCLFRTFSEQVFDVQMYHGKVRDDCIRWMRKNANEYTKKIPGDFDDYLTEMSKLRSYGSFIELHALAHAYRRNVLLFEPYNLGTWFVKDDRYQQAVLVFFSPEKHFDSIFPIKFIQNAAYCQALVYEILYVKVFKLPDVMYSVERMLHDPDGKSLNATKSCDKTNHMNEDRFVASEGKQFVFNTAEETKCVLENYLLCHFHNKDNFDTIVDAYRNKKNENDLKETRTIKSNNNTRVLFNPMLCDSKISCVRQLLNEGITPFPYKVAKALDPNIYRNIEFDSWSEVRRELRYQTWYFDQNCLQVGAKCMVQLDDLDKCIFTGYVQEISSGKGPCVVYVEDIGECRTIPYERLQAVPLNDSSSSVIPYKGRRSSAIHNLRTTCNKYSRKKVQKVTDCADINSNSFNNDRYHRCKPYHYADNSFIFTIDDFTVMNKFQPSHQEVMVMPLSVEGCKSEINLVSNEPVDMPDRSNSNKELTTYSTSGVFDTSASSCLTYGSPPYCYSYSDSVPCTLSAYLPYSAQQVTFAPHELYPGTFDGVPYSIVSPFGDLASEHRASVDIPNFQATASIAHDGSDLPLHDHVTLRYFYNLGIDFFRQNQFRLEPPTLISSTRKSDINSNLDDSGEIIELVDEMSHGMTLNAHNASDVKNNQRLNKDNRSNTKRKYGVKNSKKFANVKSNISAAAPTSYLNEHNADDIPQSSNTDCTSLPYAHVSRMAPVRVPYYTFESSHYIFPPYGPGLITSPPDVMIIPENFQHPGLCNPLEAQYPPLLFASPHAGTGYAFMGYHPPQAHRFCHDGDSNADNNIHNPAQ